MTTLVVFSFLFVLVFIIMILYLFYKQNKFEKLHGKEKEENNDDSLSRIIGLDWKIKGLLLLAVLLIFMSFAAPFIFTRIAINPDFNFSNTGPIGDTIGGLMNPFIALSGIVVTGLAFYAQYKANLLQRELFVLGQQEATNQLQVQIHNQNNQIRMQQFESQFYEMLKLHRDNISEMKIEGYDFEETGGLMKEFEKSTEGRKVFVMMKTELEVIVNLYSKSQPENYKIDKSGFHKCYNLFFSGIDSYEKSNPSEQAFISMMKAARRKHENPNLEGIETNKERKEFLPYAKLYFNYKPFSGHAQRLGHYFRHLYLTVKSISNSDIVTGYDDRMKYLKILRAQLSNHEQILLFYNWLSEYGANWENDSHAFFTEYCMIHNLWYNTLLDEGFVSYNVNYLRARPVSLRKGPMFEIDEY